MRRRMFLATAGSLLTAGCGALTGGRGGGGGGDNRPADWGDEDGPDITVNEPGTLPEPPGGSSNGVSADVDTNIRDVEVGDTEIRDPIGADEERRNGTPTQANLEASQRIGEARNILDEALAEYRSYAGENVSILDVNASHTDFDNIRVESIVDRAESKLDAAVEPATDGQKMNILALQHVAVFIRYASRMQTGLGNAFEEVSYMADRVYNESLRMVERGNRRARSALGDAESAYEVIDEEVEADAFGAYGTLSERVFRDKQTQLDAELAALQELRSGLAQVSDGVAEMQEAVPAFLDEDYDAAEQGFSGAAADFAIARSSLRLSRGSRDVESKVREVTGVAQTLEQATKDLRRAAQAQLDDERLVFYESRRAAEEHISSNDIVRNMRTMNDIIG